MEQKVNEVIIRKEGKMKIRDIVKVPEIEDLFSKPENYNDIKHDIAERGIKEPLVVNPEGKLICGYTRLAIAAELQMDDVPVRVENLTDILDMKEYAIKDNLHRRQLSKLEMIELYGKKLEAIERERALQRMKRGKADPLDTMSRGLTVDKVGEKLGMSGRTYQRWKTISEKASAKTKELLNKGVINLTTALELCKLPQDQQDLLVSRIKNLDNPYTVNWLTIKEKVFKYGRKCPDLYRRRSAEIERRETIDSQVNPFELLIRDILSKKNVSELEALNKQAEDGTLWQNMQFVSEVLDGIINDEFLSHEFLERCKEHSTNQTERDIIDAFLQDKTICNSCMYVKVYESFEGRFTDRRGFRKFMYPFAESIVRGLRPDWFIDNTASWPGCQDLAEWIYRYSREWKQQNDHDCFEGKNIEVVR